MRFDAGFNSLSIVVEQNRDGSWFVIYRQHHMMLIAALTP